MKWILSAVAILLALMILIILFWLGPTVKWVAKIAGPAVLGTRIDIESLMINPRRGTLQLSGLSVANHEVFGQSNTVSLANMDIAVDMGSIFSETVTVHHVRIASPHLVFEQGADSDNIAEYIRSINAFIGYDPNAPPEPEDERTVQKRREKEEKRRKRNSEKSPKIVIVEALEVTDAQLSLTHTDEPHLDTLIGLNQLSASMTNGIIRLHQFHVDNPQRLRSRHLFALERLNLHVEPTSIHRPPLRVLDLQLIHPHGFVEWTSDASTVSELLSIAESTYSNVMKWPLPKAETGHAIPPAEQVYEPEPPPPPPIIHQTGITDLQIHLINSQDTNLTLRVMLDRLALFPTDGRMTLGPFSISNPDRLATPDLFHLEEISLRFDPESIYTDTFSLLDIEINHPHLFLESNPDADTVGELMKIGEIIARSLPTESITPIAKPPEDTISADSNPPTAPPIELHNLQINDIQIRLLDTTQTNRPATPVMLAGIRSIAGDLTEGNVQIKTITVPNTSGFQATNLFQLALIDIIVDPTSLFSGQPRIRRVFIDSPILNLEQTETTGNVAQLQDALMAFVHPSATTTPETTAEPSDASETAPKQAVILEELLLTNLVIYAILPQPVAATNSLATGPMGKVKLSSLDPRTYVSSGKTNATSTVNAERPPLLAFDLLHVKPTEGSVELSNLRLGNAQGFANRYLIKLELFHLGFDPDSTMTDTLLIRQIRLEKPEIAYERKIATDNIKAFRQTIEGAVAQRESKMKSIAGEESGEVQDQQKVVIEHLLVQNGIVRAKISALPTAPIPLPTIELKQIGGAEGGTTLGDASSRIFNALYDSIIGAVAGATGIAGDALKGAGGLTLDTLGNLTGSLEGFMGIDRKKGEEKQPPKSKSKKRRPFRHRSFHK